MKRCKFCGAIEHKDGCPNNTCIAYVKKVDMVDVDTVAKKNKFSNTTK